MKSYSTCVIYTLVLLTIFSCKDPYPNEMEIKIIGRWSGKFAVSGYNEDLAFHFFPFKKGDCLFTFTNLHDWSETKGKYEVKNNKVEFYIQGPNDKKYERTKNWGNMEIINLTDSTLLVNLNNSEILLKKSRRDIEEDKKRIDQLMNKTAPY